MILILLDLHLFPGSGPENLSSDMNPPAFYELRQLPKLTQVEEMLIAMAIPVMQVFRIKGGNLGYRKNVLTIQQEITIERHPTRIYNREPQDNREPLRSCVSYSETLC